MDNYIDFKEFENTVKDIDKNKYHICRMFQVIDGEGKITEWSVFRCGMSTEEYFNDKNLAVLSSKKGHTIEDLKKFVEENKNELR